MIRIFLLLAALSIPVISIAADPVEVDLIDPAQRVDTRYRLFKTKNVWNFLQLDTQTGRVWQLQFAINEDANRNKFVINNDALVKDGKPGRFTLFPTKNLYNFILLDQESGKTWQVQWSTSKDQGIWPIEAKSEKAEGTWKQ